MMTCSIPVALLVLSATMAAPPAQDSVNTVLGPKAYRDGDVIEITDVTATSPRLEQGDSVTVKGRYRLDSQPSARLCLYLTQTEGDGKEETDDTQEMLVSNGLGNFELKITIKHRGALHLTYYDPKSGRPLGGTYFGTAEQLQAIADWDVSYYLDDADVETDDQSNRTDQQPSAVRKAIEHPLREQRKLQQEQRKHERVHRQTQGSLGFEFKTAPGLDTNASELGYEFQISR